MRTRAMRRVAARHTWDRLEVSFWFAPTIMGLAAVLLAWAVYWLDRQIPNAALANSRFVLWGTPSELRSALLNMAGTVLTTAGVVFTLLTLPLSTVVAQYGSRLLRVFLGDRTTQFVLGMFVATFVYCIAGAFSIPPIDVESAGPQLTATVGVYLMLATFATLILLVQHISVMLQAPNIAAGAGAQLLDVINAEMPAEVTQGGDGALTIASQLDQGASATLVDTEGHPVRVERAGYIQAIDPDTILTLVQERDLAVHLLHRPGHFVWPGAVVALVWPASRVDGHLDRLIRGAFEIGNMRTPTQDVEYAVNQLTEMAVRAMSPAINDPFTAMTCLDHMADGLAKFIRQGEKASHYYDRNGKLRLVLAPVTFDTLLSAAFDMLRHASCDNATVLLHMVEVVDVISQETNSPEARQQLIRQISLIETESQTGELIEQDRQRIQRRCEALLLNLNGGEREAPLPVLSR